MREGNYEKLGVSRRQDKITFTFCGEKEDCCAVVLVNRKDKSRVRLEVPGEFCLGSLRSVEVGGIAVPDYEYYYEINGNVVMDPYARRVTGREHWNDSSREENGYEVYAGFAEEEFDWRADRAPEIPACELFMYKLHVRGFTMEAGGKHPGTFAALMNKIGYLKRLGVTSVELMPVYEFEEMPVPVTIQLPEYVTWTSDEEDVIRPAAPKEERGKLNYWGYGPGDYFAVKASYASNPENAAVEYKTLIRRLHEHGMECIMEMFFPEGTNHNLILDALRYWVKEYHVDGFHLLGPSIPLTAVVQDNMLSRTKLFCESFPAEVAGELRRGTLFVYKEEYMYPARKILNHLNSNMREFADQQRKQGATLGYVNYIAGNNGFTLADLFMYNDKHNEANGEGNLDGNAWNFSNNYGVEGPSRRRYINSLRRIKWRNSMMMLFLAQGVPLVWAGDEIGNSQQGNNNAYCQDNTVGWLNWRNESSHRKELQFLRQLAAFRREHPILSNETPFQFCDYRSLGAPDLSFHGENAWILEPDVGQMCLGMMYCGAYSREADKTDDVYVAYNFFAAVSRLALPKLAGNREWYLVMDSASETPCYEEPVWQEQQAYIHLKPQSICVLVSRPGKSEKKRRSKKHEQGMGAFENNSQT
ncbi:MAG: alpha-amylase family glycosyl hydrolase [Muribaculaceae bacterium]|nr:alpha-amylase family glycosyl hydrolase [Roseburia sp.]MCM1431089.1 alpha-amylase family glycosyl hydrolase [Muribaculaceae bacterium]MCM1492512.1 alpha-amylase family glycosyl hydrolase [Muribaculaceae bacterium]